MRHQAPWAAGFRWLSRQDFGPDASDVCVLYAANGSPALLTPSGQEPLHLDDAAGRGYVNALLAPLRIGVEQPRTRE
ncbi:hypothetical protein [Streptomyces noursei]|uniref:hypothetical protein n=1 Tax=Streptomyces noursei TaxID=1971 RepID=UPI0023B878C1|nr:hypothetical protein [Streptomyces noursei]